MNRQTCPACWREVRVATAAGVARFHRHYLNSPTPYPNPGDRCVNSGELVRLAITVHRSAAVDEADQDRR